MNDLNFSQIKGKIASDVAVKETTTGKKLISFSLLYNSPQTTDKEGSNSNFITVEGWGKMVDILEPLLLKGLEIIVKGNIVQNRWRDKNDQPRSLHKFYADAISITDLKFEGAKDPVVAAAA